ncbi:unnamed protein product [Hyaloperonospora brassicae]|uniref:Uncharacterized protein n=1 Tax=Hyaloperonospora brassicae TaxID=162125 RepID=A0AAV0TK48_HYABA|nr:unnamed protein product [Hyaloperonospora brassicae]
MSTEKAQAFAHRVVEFADYEQCVKFFLEKDIDFDRSNDMGWTVLMSVCACGRDDLVGLCVDRTTALDSATTTNRTTVLHLSAMSKNVRVIEALAATRERKHKLQQVIDQTNAHGDTALMMACVAKNVRAVQLLVEMGANTSAANASGMTALMCAARIGNDPRPGVATAEERMEHSARILDVLLATGADVNVVEKAEGNTALHLAVLSANLHAVESLTARARGLDLTVRNRAKQTALDVCKRMSGVTSARIEDRLRDKWAQHEQAAAQLSVEMERELLLCLAVGPPTGEPNHKPTSVAQPRRKHDKKTAENGEALTSALSSASASASAPELDDGLASVSTTEPSGPDTASAEVGLQLHLVRVDEDVHDAESSWHSVVTKKSRRKDTVRGKAEAKPMRESKTLPRKPLPATAKHLQPLAESDRVPAEQTSSDHTEVPISTKPVPQASLSSQPRVPRTTKTPTSAIERRHVTSKLDDSELSTSSISYDVMNTSFHRTFPVTAELEINVEKFLIASSTSDRELEPTGSLSISQVEALQESHWQAYHYLNEKKIELTRVLEAQRVEARFALQHELMQWK